MEVYPFHHQNLFFQIITDYDLTFKEVRGILDHLIKLEAFMEKEYDNCPGGKLYSLELGQVRYEVDVHKFEVVIFNRMELT